MFDNRPGVVTSQGFYAEEVEWIQQMGVDMAEQLGMGEQARRKRKTGHSRNLAVMKSGNNYTKLGSSRT
jgi:hypothetical protein